MPGHRQNMRSLPASHARLLVKALQRQAAHRRLQLHVPLGADDVVTPPARASLCRRDTAGADASSFLHGASQLRNRAALEVRAAIAASATATILETA